MGFLDKLLGRGRHAAEQVKEAAQDALDKDEEPTAPEPDDHGHDHDHDPDHPHDHKH